MSQRGSADFQELLRMRLLSAPQWRAPVRGDFDLNPDLRDAGGAAALRDAAVLVPLIDRPDGLTVLFTLRSEEMPSHPGQVSFPGGRVDEGDRDAAHTALREAHEEVGIDPQLVSIMGFLDTYETRTGYCIMPVVGLVEPGFTLKVDEREVAEVFEVPLAFLMDPQNHKRHSVFWQGAEHFFYAMPYESYNIWGATAGMVKSFYDRLYGS